MKNFQEDFDLLMKTSLGNMEVSPPEKTKSDIFKKLSRYTLWYKIKRNSIFILAIILLNVLGIFSYKTINQTPSLIAKNVNQNKQINNISSINTQENNQNKNLQTLNETKSYNSLVNKNSNIINNKTKKNIITEPLANTSDIQNNMTENYSNSSQNTGFETKVNEQTNTSDLQTTKNETANNLRTTLAVPKMKTLNTINISDDFHITQNEFSTKKIKQALLWSFGINIGHSIVQNPMLSIPESFDDNNYSINSSMNFPSAILEMDFRAEKKHFFFDFGVQYSHFSETIKSDNILYNPQEKQYLNFTGQTTQIDTAGGYYHYYYICDSIIKIIDSVWTWRIDTNMIDNYDTLYNKIYDTMNHPEWKNSYTFIEIPFSVGWQYNFGKINIGLKTGPLLGILIGTKGFIPAYINESSSLTALNSEFKKFRLGLSWQISGVVSYFISERMLLECEPYYRFTVAGIKSTSAYRLKNNSLGLMLGIRYYF